MIGRGGAKRPAGRRQKESQEPTAARRGFADLLQADGMRSGTQAGKADDPAARCHDLQDRAVQLDR